MQKNSSLSGSVVEPNEAPQFAPPAPGATPYNTGVQLTSDSSATTQQSEAKTQNRGTLIETILLVVTSLLAIVFIWLYIQKYIEWDTISTDFDGRLNAQVAIAVADNTTQMEAEFAEREKFPYKTFTGPADYGSFSFQYPQTWSVYIAKDAANGGDFEAYFNPVEINPISTTSVNALRMKIRDATFDSVAKSYESSIKSGKLTLKNQEVGGVLANIYTGQISNSQRGAIMILKLRDKTVILQTDAEIFLDEFYRILDSVSLIE